MADEARLHSRRALGRGATTRGNSPRAQLVCAVSQTGRHSASSGSEAGFAREFLRHQLDALSEAGESQAKPVVYLPVDLDGIGILDSQNALLDEKHHQVNCREDGHSVPKT